MNIFFDGMSYANIETEFDQSEPGNFVGKAILYSICVHSNNSKGDSMFLPQEKKSSYILNSTQFRLIDNKNSGELIEGFFAKGVNILSGPPKSMKTTLSLQAGEHLSQLGNKVLYISPDEGVHGLLEKTLKMDIQDAGNGRYWDLTQNPISDFPQIEDCIKNIGQIDVIVIDTLHSAFPGKFKQNYAQQLSAMNIFKKISDKYSVSFVILLHATKSGCKNCNKADFSGVYGTYAMTGSVTSTVIMAKDTDNGSIYAHRQGRFCQDITHILRFNENTFRLEIDDEPKVADLLDGNLKLVFTALMNNPGPMQLSDIAKTVGKESNLVNQVLAKLIERRLVLKPSRGIYEILPPSNPEVTAGSFLEMKYEFDENCEEGEFYEETEFGNIEKPYEEGENTLKPVAYENGEDEHYEFSENGELAEYTEDDFLVCI